MGVDWIKFAADIGAYTMVRTM